MVFWVLNDALPANLYVLNMLGIVGADFKTLGKLASRLFWRGDIYTLRCNDQASYCDKYLSLPPGSELIQTVNIYLRHRWDNQGLEKQVESWRQTDIAIEEDNRNKELVRLRMYDFWTCASRFPLRADSRLGARLSSKS